MTKKETNRIKYPGVCLLIAIVIGAVCITAKTDRSNLSTHVIVNAIPVELPGGWGYKIEVNHKLYIFQNQIPCIQGKQLFPTRHSAMALAQIVEQKIRQGLSPAVSRKEVERVLLPLAKNN